MNENYTQAANSRCFGLVDSTLEEIWADIGRTPEDTEAALWKRKLQRIAAQYVLSSRFALMRILCERAGGGETGFTAQAFKCEEYKPKKSHRIDFIFYRGDVEVCDAEIVRDRKGAMYPSDHYFLFSEFTLR